MMMMMMMMMMIWWFSITEHESCHLPSCE